MENEKPSYYAVIPANVRYDKDLTDREKLLYGEITTLTQKTGECWASNEYFANLYEVSVRSIQRSISNLINKKYINKKLIYKKDKKEVEKRIITLVTDLSGGWCQICHGGGDKNVTDNNTSINNININNICPKEKKEPLGKKSDSSDFFELSIEKKFNLIAEYCKEKNYDINIKHFVEYYEETKWHMANGKKIKNWKLAVCSWANKSYNNNSQKNFSSSPISSAKPVDDYVHYETVDSGEEFLKEHNITFDEINEGLEKWREQERKKGNCVTFLDEVPKEVMEKILNREF